VSVPLEDGLPIRRRFYLLSISFPYESLLGLGKTIPGAPPDRWRIAIGSGICIPACDYVIHFHVRSDIVLCRKWMSFNRCASNSPARQPSRGGARIYWVSLLLNLSLAPADCRVGDSSFESVSRSGPELVHLLRDILHWFPFVRDCHVRPYRVPSASYSRPFISI